MPNWTIVRGTSNWRIGCDCCHVSLGFFLTRSGASTSKGDPRCELLDPGEFSMIVVNCKCKNTTELYTATLSDEESYVYLNRHIEVYLFRRWHMVDPCF
jgi:hypothetical protein